MDDHSISWASVIYVAIGSGAAGAWAELDVTSAARAGSFTLALIAQSTDGGAFFSRESADEPQLITTP